MSVETNFATLKTKLQILITALNDAATSSTDATERKRIASATDLPRGVVLKIDAYFAGDRRIPPQNMFQAMIGNCTRGFPEIGADVTENPGPIANLIKDVLDFCIAHVQTTS